jgi:WD40 repeat protein
MLSRSLRFLFGDDIFVSYSRADAATYAAGLASALTAKHFACKLDQWGSQPGKEIPRPLKNALTRSSILVLVGTPAAAVSEAVGQEIREFHKTGRMIVPIDFDGATRRAAWWPSIEGLHLSAERTAALTTGDPSPEIVNRIEKTYVFRRRDQRLRAATIATTVVLAVLVGVAAIAALLAGREARKAAIQGAAAAEATTEAGRQKAMASAATLDAQKQQEIAAAKRLEAEQQTEIAAEQRRVAEEQKRLALSRQLLARAELAKNQGDDRVVGPLSLAIEAWQHYPSPEVDATLRYGLDRLPRLVADFPHPGPVTAIAFHPDGQHVTTLCADHQARVWSIGQPRPVAAVALDGAGLAVLSPDGGFVGVAQPGDAARANEAILYRLLPSGAAEAGRVRHAAPIAALAFDGRSQRFATAGSDRTVKVWQTGSLSAPVAEIDESKTGEGSVRAVKFSADGTHVALGTYVEDPDDDEDDVYPVYVWTTDPARRALSTGGRSFELDATGSSLATFRGDTWWVKRVTDAEDTRVTRVVEDSVVDAIALYETAVVTASRDRTVRVYDLENDAKELFKLGHDAPVEGVAFEGTSMGAALIAASATSVHRWHRRPGGQAGFYEALRIANKQPITAWAVSRREVAIASPDGHVRVWQKTYNGGETGLDHGGSVSGESWSRNGRYLAVLGRGQAWVWDGVRGRVSGVIRGKVPDYDVAVSDDGTQVITGGAYETPPRLWDVATGDVVRDLGPNDARFVESPDRETIAVVDDTRVAVWRRGAARPFQRLAFSTKVRWVIASARGAYLAVVRENERATLVRSDSDTPLATFETAGGSAVAFSPDEKRVAVRDGATVRLIETRTGKTLATLTPSAAVRALRYSPDGSRVAASCEDETVWLWTADGRQLQVYRHAS